MGENEQAYTRCQLVLTQELSGWLDEQAQAIQQASGAVVNRSALVRAALRAVGELDPARFRPRSESELSAVLIAVVRRGCQSLGW